METEAVPTHETDQGITKGDPLQKIAGLSLIVGAVLMVLFFIGHPQPDDQTVASFLKMVSENMGGRWEAVQLLRVFGVLAVLAGFIGVYRSIAVGRAEPWVRIGIYGIAVSTVFWLAHTAVELGLPVVLEEWEEATEGARKDNLFLIASSIRQVDEGGLITIAAISYGLALVVIGIALSLSKVYPNWLGWIVIVLGAPMAAAGAALSLVDANEVTMVVVILYGLSYLWTLALGVWLTRKVW